MNELIKELKTVLEEKRLSQEAASTYIGCSSRTVFRWLHGLKTPNLTSQRLIKKAIEKIREEYPDKESSYELALKARSLYRKIKNDMTLKEKSELLDINNSKGTKAYIKKLQELVEKYDQ